MNPQQKKKLRTAATARVDSSYLINSTQHTTIQHNTTISEYLSLPTSKHNTYLTNLHAVGHGRGVELDQTQDRGSTVGEVTEDDAGVFGVADVAEGGLGLLLLAGEVPDSDVSVRRLFRVCMVSRGRKKQRKTKEEKKQIDRMKKNKINVRSTLI